MISGKPVRSEISRTAMPASASSRAVPPVETISIPRSARPRANSRIPVLSDTESRARAMRTSSGRWSAAVTFWLASSMQPRLYRSAAVLGLDQDAARTPGIDVDPAGGDQANCLREQLVLDRVQALQDVIGVRGVGELDRTLEDHGAAVHPLVDEVHGDPE